MSYETEEQQVEQLKAWWSENGTPLIVGAVLGLAGFAGWKFWTQKQIEYQAGASDLYVKVSEILESDNKAGLAESAQAIITQYPDSSYAIMAAFHLAKLAIDASDFDKAATQLNWVLENHGGNELADVAKLRLARVFIQQDKANEALKLLEMDDESGYYPLANLIKGDALLALDRKDDALQAYQIASADLEVVARHPTLQIKIENLSATNAVKLVTENATETENEQAPEAVNAVESSETTQAEEQSEPTDEENN